MKKKMLGVIVLLLFSGITMGYTIGQVITQTQFDNQDFTTANLGYSLDVNCREDANKSVCVTQAKQEIKNELIAFRKLVRKDLTQQQTNYGNEITKNDFNSSIILV